MEEKLKKYENIITITEFRMLNTLIRYKLLLDLREEVNELGRKHLLAFNLENECIFRKELKQ